jgi:hypothetical protein
MDVEERLERIERLLAAIAQRSVERRWYTVQQFAAMVDLEEWTVRACLRTKPTPAQ